MLTKGKTVWKGGSPNRIQGNYILFSQFFCKSITALKSKVYLKKCFFFLQGRNYITSRGLSKLNLRILLSKTFRQNHKTRTKMKWKFRTHAIFVKSAHAWSTEDYRINLIVSPQKILIRQKQNNNAKQNLQMLVHRNITQYHAAD